MQVPSFHHRTKNGTILTLGRSKRGKTWDKKIEQLILRELNYQSENSRGAKMIRTGDRRIGERNGRERKNTRGVKREEENEYGEGGEDVSFIGKKISSSFL